MDDLYSLDSEREQLLSKAKFCKTDLWVPFSFFGLFVVHVGSYLTLSKELELDHHNTLLAFLKIFYKENWEFILFALVYLWTFHFFARRYYIYKEIHSCDLRHNDLTRREKDDKIRELREGKDREIQELKLDIRFFKLKIESYEGARQARSTTSQANISDDTLIEYKTYSDLENSKGAK